MKIEIKNAILKMLSDDVTATGERLQNHYTYSTDGDVMMSHWFADNGRYKTVATRIKL